MFMRTMRAGPADRVLDVGVAADDAGAGNYLEHWYPWPQNLVACGLEGPPAVCAARGIRFVRADGRKLPLADQSFDIVHCNAVIEHVGPRDQQRRLIGELLRVGRRLWITTPDAEGPLEPHTLLPLAHWLPQALRDWVYRAAGRGYYADPRNLNPLSAQELRRCFPQPLQNQVIIRRQYLFGLPTVLVACLKK